MTQSEQDRLAGCWRIRTCPASPRGLAPFDAVIMQKRPIRFQGDRSGRLPPLLPSQLVAGVERRLEDMKREAMRITKTN